MTEDDDRVAYLAGEDGVELDELSRADLDDLRSLLADEALWAVPPDGLEGAVVAAIAAEAASRPADPDVSEPVVPAPPSPPRTGDVVPIAGRRRRGARVLVAAAAVVLIAAGGLVVATRRGDDAGTQVSLEATDVLPDASGEAHVRRTDSGWRILLDATGLPRLDDGQFYEAWLKSDDGVLVPIGTFNEGADVVLWAGVSPVQFPTLTVTRELADGDQASSGQVVLRGTIVLD